MSQRTERIAAEIRHIIGDLVAQGGLKDPRIRDAGILTFTHVRVTGDLRQARVFFTVHGADQAALERVRHGLGSAGGFLQRELGRRLHTKVTPALSFEVDRVFEQEAKIDALLREISARDER